MGALDVAPKSWISLGDADGPKAPNGSHPAAAVYGAGTDATAYPPESNTTQANVNLVTGLGNKYTATQVSEAFDEPLDATTVKTIARQFATPAGRAAGLFN